MGKGVVRSAQALVAAMLLAMPLLFTACSETNETQEEYPDWKNKNQTFWNRLYTETRRHATAGYTSWKIFKTYTKQDSISGVNTDYIIVHVKQAGTGSGSPLGTDSVSIRYTGQLLPSTSYPAGLVFDTTSPSGTTPATSGVAHLAVNGLVDGFATHAHWRYVGGLHALDAGLWRNRLEEHTGLLGIEVRNNAAFVCPQWCVAATVPHTCRKTGRQLII